MIGSLLKFLNPFGALADAYKAKQEALTDENRVNAERDIEKYKARTEALKVAVKYLATRIIQFGFAFPYVIYINKLIIWDKIIMDGGAATDDLSDNLWSIGLVIVSFYFAGPLVDKFRR